MKRTKERLGQQPLRPDRVRSIRDGGFAFIPNRFLHDGFFAALHDDELVLYFLLVLAGDRNGLSFYHYDSLCSLAGMTLERYLAARNALIDKDLVAFNGSHFQVLSLPSDARHLQTELPLQTQEEFEDRDPATVRLLVRNSLRTAAKRRAT
ncbi:MAG: hypothetical protein GY906_01770 [bacterium]|nr:hypothetical protein [bacterium]